MPAVSSLALSPVNMGLLRKSSRGCRCPSTPLSSRSAPRPSTPPLSFPSCRSTASTPAGASATCASLAFRTLREERLASVCLSFCQDVVNRSFNVLLGPLGPDPNLQGDQLADDPHRGRRHSECRARDVERSDSPDYQHVQDPGHPEETGQPHTHRFRLTPSQRYILCTQL